jgi:molecular chaperone Hsp33
LAADGESAAGLLLQRLPETSQGDSSLQPQLDVDDAWQRVQLLADTLKPEELQQLDAQQLLGRVFAEDDVRLFEPAPVFFRCRCSRERVENMLRALGAEEVRSVLAEKGMVEVNCDFCNRAYRLDPVDVEQVLADNVVDGDSAQRH